MSPRLGIFHHENSQTQILNYDDSEELWAFTIRSLVPDKNGRASTTPR